MLNFQEHCVSELFLSHFPKLPHLPILICWWFYLLSICLAIVASYLFALTLALPYLKYYTSLPKWSYYCLASNHSLSPVSFWIKSELLSLAYEVPLEGPWPVSLDSACSAGTITSSATKCLEVALKQHALTHLYVLVNIFPGILFPRFYNLTNFCLCF